MRKLRIFKYEKTPIVDIQKNKLPALKSLKLPYVLKPGEYLLGRTIEEFDTPLDLMSFYAASSTSVRIGLSILYGGINDPGYQGKAILGIHNVSPNPIKIFYGMELLYTAFLELKGTPTPIQTKYMGGKLI